MTAPFCATGVIDARTCGLLVDAYDSCAPYSMARDQHGNPIVHWSHPYLSGSAATTVLEAVRRCQRLTAGAFHLEPLYPETVLLAALSDGQGHVAHADNERRIGDEWVPNHTPQRNFAGILYLNSGFEGGELRFEGDEPRIFRPAEGLYVSFPCDRHFVHEVTPVERGRRYSLALWYTRLYESANHRLVSAVEQLSSVQDHLQ